MSAPRFQATCPLGHLRFRLSVASCGARSWALLPGDLAHPRADVPLVSGFLDGPEGLTPEALEDAARHLRAFDATVEELV